MPQGSAEQQEALLESLARQGAAAWPGLGLDPARFVEYVRSRTEGLPAQRIAELRAADLFIACACVLRVDGALERFHESYLVALPIVFARMRIPSLIADEARSALVERLLSSASRGGRTLLADYAGTGSLRSWLQIVAAREAFGLMRKEARDAEVPANLQEVVPTEAIDPELDYLKATYQQELAEAFEQTAATLSPRERNLLRYSYLDRLSIDEIGAIYHVHRATAARWVSAAQERLAEGTRMRLRARLNLDGDDVESILRLIRSELDLSVRRHLTRISETEEM